MIPLMMQKDYSPKGWLGLILGTRMWYSMWDAEKDDDDAFERRVDSVVREIGDRGKVMLPEAVPPPAAAAAVASRASGMSAALPVRALAPAPAPTLASSPKAALAPAPAPAPAAAVALASAPAPAPAAVPPKPRLAPAQAALGQTFTPTMDRTMPLSTVEQPGGSIMSGGSLGELAVFMETQQRLQIEREDKLESKLESQRLQMETKLESQRLQMEAKLEQVAQQAKAATDAKSQLLELQQAISESQLTILSTRVEAMHAARLLSDEELFHLEDSVGDYIGLRSSREPPIEELRAAVDRVLQLIGMVEGMPKDTTCARQIRRRCLSS